MAKVNAPLLSFSASGTVAGTQTYSKWKGRPYVRQRVTPSNPDTAEQQLTRNTFAWLNNVWKNGPALLSAPWDLYATGQVLTGRNAFVGQNTRVLRTETDLANFIFSPGAKGGIIPASIGAVAGVGEITVTLGAPTLPSGWSITRGVAAAIRDQDPQSAVLYTVTALDDAAAPYSIVLTGLSTNLYRVGGWFEYEKPDGSVAYSANLSASATPT